MLMMFGINQIHKDNIIQLQTQQFQMIVKVLQNGYMIQNMSAKMEI